MNKNNEKKYTEHDLYMAFKQFVGRGISQHPYDEKELKKQFERFKKELKHNENSIL